MRSDFLEFPQGNYSIYTFSIHDIRTVHFREDELKIEIYASSFSDVFRYKSLEEFNKYKDLYLKKAEEFDIAHISTLTGHLLNWNTFTYLKYALGEYYVHTDYASYQISREWYHLLRGSDDS